MSTPGQPGAGGAGESHRLDIEIVACDVLNLAMAHSGVPILPAVRVRNAGRMSLAGATLVIRLGPDLGEAHAVSIPAIKPGEIWEPDPIDVPLPHARLRAITEAEAGSITWSLEHEGSVFATETVPLRLLPFNEWPGNLAPPSLLAVFVLPNHAAIARVLQETREILGKETGDDAISGYQTNSRPRVVQQVNALYRAVQRLGISYIGVPASFEETGQKVRLPDQLLSDRLGNCLDLTILFAACLEQMGLAPLLVLVAGHAFPAVWLEDDSFHDGTVDDAARLRTQVQLKRLLAFDSSTTVSAARPPLEEALRAADLHLADDEAFHVAVDVKAARKLRYTPLPVRASLEEAQTGVAATPAARGDTELSSRLAAAFDAPQGRSGSTTASEPLHAREADPVRRRFRRWSERLLDLTARNRLLNFRLDRGVIPLEIPDVAEFENRLARDVDFEVVPRPDEDPADHRAAAIAEKRVDPEAERRRLLADLDKHRLHTPITTSHLIPAAKKIGREARTDLEEGGANTLFAVVGVLRWFEAESSELPRHAPLLLIPAKIAHEPARDRIILDRADDDAIGNVTLVEKMRLDFGVDLSFLADPPTDDHGVDVPQVLRRAREAIQSRRRWEVREEVYVGLFKFGKFLMWVDLEENKEALLQNSIVNQIAKGVRTAASGGPDVPEERRLDQEVPPAALPTVVDADSTQLRAVLAALRGASFVLQGPPGTGKSQTITNLIAAALAQRQTVLFVSEKMAALEVVYRRLKQAGVEDFCLELHSHKANKKQVLESLGRSLERSTRASGGEFAGNAEHLQVLRGQLNDYVRALHQVRPLGMSFYAASARVLELSGKPRLAVPLPEGVNLERARREQMLGAAREVALRAQKVEPAGAHPWRDSSLAQWSGALEESIRHSLEDLARRASEVEQALARVAQAAGCAPAGSLDDQDALAAAGTLLAAGPLPPAALDAQWETLASRVEALVALMEADEQDRAQLAGRWSAGFFALGDEAADLRDRFAHHARSIALIRFFALRKARRRLKPLAKEGLQRAERVAKDLTRLADCVQRRGQINADEPAISRALGPPAAKESSPAQVLRETLDRVTRLLEALRRLPPQARDALAEIAARGTADRRQDVARAAAELGLRARGLRENLRAASDLMRSASFLPAASDPSFLTELRRAIERRREALPRLREWCQYARESNAARDVGLAALVEAHLRGEVGAEHLEACLEHSLLAQWVDLVRDAEPVLRDFDGVVQARRIDEFRRRDMEHIKGSRQHVVAALDAARPARLAGNLGESEQGVLQRELKKKRMHLPLRRLFQRIPNLLPRLKPCFLMSPMSVAQYLPPEGKKFDLVVFDEASQIGTHDAIGAIARGDQVVVVGDSKQLPPTAFFEKQLADDEGVDEVDVEDLESILDEAIVVGIPEQSLGWHYRSRHHSLIEFSNRHYYDDRLHVFPAARGRVPDLGVKWHHVPDGVYLFGKDRTNPREAQALVDWLVAELRETAPGKHTFGVVAFSMAQQTMVLDLLDEARRSFPEIEPHFSTDLDEPVFVKNLENVQGDERDEILFSICYAAAEDGKVRMNFGPLNRAGGERRLNVAITRARCLLRVFSSMTHHDIDAARTAAKGALHLREFLRFAQERGDPSAEGAAGSAEHDSEFERQVCDALRARGFEVDAQVGCGGYRIDLGVRHPRDPGVYVLGVECDGLPYHSGATARDRDRLRQQVLENLGWRLHRVWSTDWWFQRDREVEKLAEAVESAIRAADSGTAPAQAEPAMPVAPITAPARHAVPEEPAPQEEQNPLPVGHRTFAAAPTSGATDVIEEAVDGPPVETYVRAELRVLSGDPEDLFEPRFERRVRDAITRVVAVEGPVHQDVVAKAVTQAFCVQRMTARFRGHVLDAIQRLAGEGAVLLRDAFLWPKGTDPDSYARIRGLSADETARTIDAIAIEELAAAAGWYLQHALSMPPKDLIRLTASAFAFLRVGKDVEKRISVAIDQLVARDRAVRTADGRVEWKKG
ncbi:MAG: DUF3320 domain-containing protein [Planctomycetes bacterium]|nr:DUF3320 domain-containing protein [Planctomycetota bacterium]